MTCRVPYTLRGGTILPENLPEPMQKSSLQRMTYLVALTGMFFYVLYIAQDILQPVAFAVLFTLLFMPISSFFEKRLSITWSVALTFITVLIPLVGLITLLSWQSVNVLDDLTVIGARMREGVVQILQAVNSKFGISQTESLGYVEDNIGTLLTTPITILTDGLTASTGVLASLALTLIYTFLLLIYRSSIRMFIISQVSEKNKETASRVLQSIRYVVQNYLSGMLIVMIILGTLNSIGLMILGVDYAFFWGFLAALLAVIPYIGTVIGGLLPFLYSVATAGSFLQPLGVVILFTSVQFIEGNLITPKIVGESVKVNPLAAIFALVVGNAVWGIGGMILALPLMGILRVIFGHIDYLKPVGLLFSSKLYYKNDRFVNVYDSDRFRLMNFFKPKEEED